MAGWEAQVARAGGRLPTSCRGPLLPNASSNPGPQVWNHKETPSANRPIALGYCRQLPAPPTAGLRVSLGPGHTPTQPEDPGAGQTPAPQTL